MGKTSLRLIASQVDATIVMHKKFKEAYDGILDLIYLNTLSEVSYGGVVIAPSGCGKSSLIKSVQQSLDNNPKIPAGSICLRVSAAATTTTGQLVKDLMKQLGYQTVVRASSIADHSDLLATKMKERKVVAVFVDESQHISRGSRAISAAANTDWMKTLRDAAGVTIVLLGTRDSTSLAEINDQLSSRGPTTYKMSEFQLNEDWSGLLLAIAKEIRAFDFMPITGFEKQLFKMTKGVPRTLKQILIASAAAALENNKTSLDLDSLKKGYRRVFGDTADVEKIVGQE